MMDFDDPLQFWETFSNAMNENPPPQSEIDAVLPQFWVLGIKPGKQWKREDVSPPIADVMKRAAENVGAMSLGIMPLVGKLANGWIISPLNVGMTGVRLWDTRRRSCIRPDGEYTERSGLLRGSAGR
jgi:hypothetical protein